MPATTVRATPRPDARIPVFTLAPQVVATMAAGAAAGQGTARLAFVLALAVNVPLWVAGRVEHRNPDLPAIRPAVALGWAVVCATVVPGLVGDRAADAGVAAAWSSVAIGLLLYLVPGPWSRIGALFAHRASHRVPVRHAVAYVSRRLVGIALLASAITFVPAPMASTASAAVALGAVVVWHALEDR